VREAHHKAPLSHILSFTGGASTTLPHSDQPDTASEICSSANMSSANANATIPSTGSLNTQAIISEDEGNQPASSPERLRFIPYTTTAKDKWNGDPMDWKSWPTGRSGPFVSDAQIQEVMGIFRDAEGERDELSRTEIKVFHIAEYSSTVQGGFDVYHTRSE
jgi:hypothetical protein